MAARMSDTPEQAYASLKELINFPAQVEFRIIVEASVLNALEQIAAAIKSIEPEFELKLKGEARPSRSGRYVSYTVPVWVNDAVNLEQIYKTVGTMPCVRHII